jgi:hypothetical protein
VTQGLKSIDPGLVAQAARAYFEPEVKNTILFDGVVEMLDDLKKKVPARLYRVLVLITALDRDFASPSFRTLPTTSNRRRSLTR